MHTQNKFPKLMLLALLLLSATACFNSGNRKIVVNPAFGKYISGYTANAIHREEPIRIELAEAVEVKNPVMAAKDSASSQVNETPLPDSTLLEDIFEFEPEIEGRAVWTSNRTIEFIPDRPLPTNQYYVVEFDLGRLKKVPGQFETFRFGVSTIPQNMTVALDGLRNYDDYDIEWLKLSGRITTEDTEDSALMRQTLKAVLNGNEFPVQWDMSYSKHEFYFYIDSIPRTHSKGLLEVSWDGSPVKTMVQNKQEFKIPALSDFTVSSIQVKDDGDQVVEVYFSDPVLYTQNLKGIVTLDGSENPAFTIDGNLLKVYPEKRLSGEKNIRISTGFKNFKSYKMNTAYGYTLMFEEPKPALRLKKAGSILPNSGGLIFPFDAIAVKAVDVRVIKIYQNNVFQFLQVNDLNGGSELARVGKIVAEKKIDLNYDKRKNLKQWNTHLLDLGKLMKPDPGSIYRVCIRIKKEYALCNCPEETETDEEAPESISPPGNDASETDDNWNEYTWDGYNSPEDGYRNWSYYSDDYYQNPCDDDFYSGKSILSNILASDIGMIYKLDENKMSHAIVSNMVTAQPIAGCTVEYCNYQRQVIARGVTDAAGMLDIKLNEKPFMMLTSYGAQRGYMKLGDSYCNALSQFDIEGEMVQKGIKGFIYGERGVWRPGDSLYLNFMMEDKENRLPPNYPIHFELQDPSGQVVYRSTKTKNTNRLYDLRLATANDAPTGIYMAVVRVGNRVFTQNLKIETVKPNRLKIYLDLNGGRITMDSNGLIGTLRAQWLHGAVAKKMAATVKVSLSPVETRFTGYDDYVFDSPARNFYSDATTIVEDTLDENGKAPVYGYALNQSTAPGILRATFYSRVFEPGGDFSSDRFSATFAPYKNFVGIKTPATSAYDNTLVTGKKHAFAIASVNADGKPVNVKKIQVKVYKIQWRWWYERSAEEEDFENYISRAGTIVMKDTIIATVNGKIVFYFGTEYPEHGRYLITATDLQGGHQTGKVVFIDWPYWSRVNRSDNENASMLSFSSDKTQYTTGEKIKLTIPSPANGKALVSVETGNRVVKKFWINTQKGETHYEFAATADMAPNAYLHITLLQPHAQTQNDLPIRMYGVIPVTVDDPNTHLHPLINMPDELKPESRSTIKVREQKGRKMTYTLAIVDEGLLDLTRFATPQPWTTFYAREALGVKTWDMYNDVIGAYAGKMDKLLGIGGDGDGTNRKGAKANRFKPMVICLGPFTVEAGQEKSHRIEVPNYVGSVRVMVVAENNGAYGNGEKTVAVRKPLMVLATLPRVLGPTETVSLPVDVFAMDAKVKDVRISVEVNELLQITGNAVQSQHFEKPGDEVVNFSLKVAAKTGIAKVKVTATCGKEKATQEIELDVRLANPRVVESQNFTLAAGQSTTAGIVFKGVDGTKKAIVEVSSIPALGLDKRLEYLVRYPHGCIEQTTSAAFPQLYVHLLTEMKESQKNEITGNVKAALRRLQRFQTAGGGFSYWPGESQESEWGTNYAGHFMIEAEKQGYSLPPNMKSRWIKYQQEKARNWANTNNQYVHAHGNETWQHIQAYRLFVLALTNAPESGAMNRLREEKHLSAAARWRLAAAYQLAAQTEIASQLIKGLPVHVGTYQELSYSYGSEIRDEAMILETLSLMKAHDKCDWLVKTISTRLASDMWMNTQETAYSLLAMCAYTGVKENGSATSFTYSLNGSNAMPVQNNRPMCQLRYNDRELAGNNQVKITNTGKGMLYVKVLVSGIPLSSNRQALSNGLTMQVKYLDMKGAEINPTRLTQGTDFIAEVKVSNPGTHGYLNEMTLNQIFASGWEIHNARLFGNETNSSWARYRDIRDDRVYTYYDLSPQNSHTFRIQLNATYLGRFYLPAVYSEAMYDASINASLPGCWVEVVK